MIHVPIVTSELVTKQVLKEWLLSLPDSRWDDSDPSVETGFVTIDGCWLMISGDTELNPYYESEEIAALEQALTAPPKSSLEIIHRGSNVTFQKAAHKMAQLMTAKWSGVLADEVIGH